MCQPPDLPVAESTGHIDSKRKRRMTARWRYTNQRNARASTGPKTALGKARVAGNALRHGLSLPVASDMDLAPEIVELAHTIAQSVVGRSLDGWKHELACRVAETFIDLRRIRLAKRPVSIAIHTDVENCLEPLKQLLRLDRYEARALVRRRCAIRAFQAAVMPLILAKAPRQNKAMEEKVSAFNEAPKRSPDEAQSADIREPPSRISPAAHPGYALAGAIGRTKPFGENATISTKRIR
jgi:hypothetical protein